MISVLYVRFALAMLSEWPTWLNGNMLCRLRFLCGLLLLLLLLFRMHVCVSASVRMYFYHRSCITSSFLFANKIDARPFNVALCVYVYSD